MLKRSIIIDNNEEIIRKLGEGFLNYIPEENQFAKVCTLGRINYDYLYIVNFKDDFLNRYAKLFENSKEEFVVFNDSFNNQNEIFELNIAFHLSTYLFHKDDEVLEKEKSVLKFQDVNDDINKSTVIAQAITRARDLVNEPSNFLTTSVFAEYIKRVGRKLNMRVEEFDKSDLQQMGANGILAVNQGSEEPARLIQLEYKGTSFSEKPYVLVGKGLVFDAGGYSLKPSASIVNMKSDMGGAATMVSVIEAIAKLKLPINVTCLIPITDNLISSTAYRPDDVIKMMNGKTVEVISTDAEGRLILADTLTYAATKLNPELIIDAATLTGAVIVALGEKTTGIFGNDNESINLLYNETLKASELAWHMPINKEHREGIKGTIATLKNSKREGGSCTAAAFLENFVEELPWIHLDIAGSSWSNGTSGLIKRGGTGSMVYPLINFFRTISKDKM